MPFKHTEGPNKGQRNAGFGILGGICNRKDFSPGYDLGNHAVVTAIYGDNKPMQSPEYDPIFASIAAHALVSIKYIGISALIS